MRSVRTTALASALTALLACVAAAQQQLPRTPAQIWNDNFDERARHKVKYEPNPFLAEVTEKRKPGTALDIGMGQGRNA